MNILLLKGFNNYFNRIVKKYSTLEDYKAQSDSYLEFANINFNPNDGVATTLVIGGPTQTEGDQILFWERNGTPDYLITYEQGDGHVNIVSRWFVLESERTTAGQYRIALKRDVLVDHLDEILNAPCFVEKGIVNETDNALLYNSEALTYNQIKKSETLLQDSTECGWIIGYVGKNFNHTSGLTPGVISADDAEPINYIDEANLPFSVNPAEPSIVIAADATKQDLNLMLPIAWVDARYGGWGTVRHQRKQSFNIFNSGSIPVATNAVGKNQPYVIIDGYKSTSSLEETPVSAYDFLRGGTWGSVSFENMTDAFKNPNGSTFVVSTGGINDNLTINIDLTQVASDPTKISAVAKKYAAESSDISGGVFGNVARNMYVDYTKVIGSNAYTQMKNYCTSTYGWSNIMNYYNGKLAAKLANYNACIKTSTTPNITSYDGKMVKIGSKFYKMFVSSINAYHVIIYNTSSERMPAYSVNGINTIQTDTDSTTASNNYMNQLINGIANIKDDQNTNLFSCQTSWKAGASVVEILPKYSVVLEEVANENVMTGGSSESFTSSEYTQGTTYDAAFDMFAIPYGRLAFKCANGTNTYYTSKSEGLGISRWLATYLGSNNGHMYDLQILPYCPSDNIRSYMATHNVLDLSAISGHYQVVFRAPAGTSTSTTSAWSPCSFIFTPLSCKGTFDINKQVRLETEDWSDALNYKIANETQLVRLCSPNWGSMFEFSLAKNNGVSKFNVDYTYKPSQPYIHINPDFKFLYGQDWDDSRGLILGGDFSIQSSDSAWIEYQNNNKNYQAIFNRQVENLDVNQQIEYEQHMFQNQVGIATGSIGGMAGGAMTGLKMGGPWGAAAGAIAGFAGGTALSVVGGMKDMDWLRRSQAESKDYMKDMYGYNLRNIQARPDSLARTESLNNNNKIWPVIEIYDCTDIEKENLVNKIRYNGMTIMVLGKLADFDYSEDFNQVYVKGQLVRCESIKDDFHIIDAIYQEVAKGFFVVQGV